MTSWTRPDDERPVRPLEMEGGVAAAASAGTTRPWSSKESRRRRLAGGTPCKTRSCRLRKKCHELTHLPYRSWCSHCVRVKGKAIDHRKAEQRPEDSRGAR